MRRLALALSLLLLPAGVQAQPAPAPNAGARGYLLHVADPHGLLSTAPLVLVSEASAAERRLLPLDNGAGADVVAGDRIYSAAIEAEFVHPWLELEVRAGGKRWRGDFSIRPRTPASIFVRLGRDGVMLAGSTMPARTPRPGAPGPGLRNAPDLPKGADPRPGRSMPLLDLVLWVALLAYLGLSLALLGLRAMRRRARVSTDDREATSSTARDQPDTLLWRLLPPSIRRHRRLVTQGPPLFCALAVSLPLLLRLDALAGPDTFRTFDWLETAKLDAYSRLSLLSWGALPHWNPLLLGGFPQLCHPSDSSLSPLILPTLLLGEAAGMKLNVMLALALGALGVTLLGRDRLGLEPLLACFAGCAYAVAGWVPSRVAVGYYESALYAAFPLAAWLLLQSRGHPWRLLGATVMLALAAMHIHLGLPMLILALALLCLLELARGALGRCILWRFPLACAGAACLAAAKLIPMWGYLQQLGFRRVTNYATFDAFYSSLTDLGAKLIWIVPTVGQYDAHGMTTRGDFGFVGLGLPLAALAGVALIGWWALPRALRAVAALAALFCWLCLGFNAPVDLFRALWSAPLFHSMRGALRYFSFGLVWFGCLLAAGGLQLLARRIVGGRARLAVVAAVALVSLAWPAVQSMGRYWTSFDGEVVPPRRARSGFYQVAINPRDRSLHMGGKGSSYDHGNLLIYANLKAGIGSIYAPEDLPVPPAARGLSTYDVHTRVYYPNRRYPKEARCQTHHCGAKIMEVGPNHIRARARFQRPDTLVLNFNGGPRWRVARSSTQGWLEPGETNGLLSVRFPRQGDAELVLIRTISTEFWLGLSISLATLVLMFTVNYAWRRRRQPRRGDAAGEPGAQGSSE